MSVFKWAYDPERCDGRFCCGDCDECISEDIDMEDLIDSIEADEMERERRWGE
jgi:hypothetical protein